ncbi:hypothetical protein Hanom_Chr00s025703g01764801 [Helianthus anomalus]
MFLLTTPKIVVKGIVERRSPKRRPSKESQSSLIDEPVVNPADISQEGVDLTKVTFEQYIKLTEDTTTKDQSANVQTESPEIDMSMVGRGKVQLKKKPQKKRKGSDEEDSTYTPTGEEKKKLRIKRKAVQTGVIPRNAGQGKGCIYARRIKRQK